MISIRKLAALLTAGAMVLSISACAKVDKIGKVKDEISKINDFNSTLKFDVTMKVAENDTNVISETEISYLKDPLLLKMIRTTKQSETENKDDKAEGDAADSTTNDGSKETADTDETAKKETEASPESTTEGEDTVMYAEGKDSAYTIYMGYAGKWMKQSLKEEDMGYITKQYNVPEIVKLILTNGKDFKESAKEKVNDVDAIKFDGALDVTALQTFINETKVLDFIGMSGLPDTFYEGVGDTPVSVWIDKKTNLPVKFSLDISACVQKLTDNLIATSGQEVKEEQKLYLTKYLIESDIRDVNNVAGFELPEETKTAEEYVAPEQTTDQTTTDGAATTTEPTEGQQNSAPAQTDEKATENNLTPDETNK